MKNIETTDLGRKYDHEILSEMMKPKTCRYLRTPITFSIFGMMICGSTFKLVLVEIL